MTDEEMAEEYFESECLHSYADTEEELKEDVEEAFLAGLKAGRPQWHDLREDKNDLPEEYDIIQKAFGIWKERRDTHIVQNQDGERVCCLNGKWYYEEGGEAYVIAWCEIPTFDKE